jgi:uncharacterized protein (DUF2336 family)
MLTNDEYTSNPNFVSSDEYRRLTDQSLLTREFVAAKNAYEVIASDHSTLLGQLTKLINQLAINSSVNGRGQLINAGTLQSSNSWTITIN